MAQPTLRESLELQRDELTQSISSLRDNAGNNDLLSGEVDTNQQLLQRLTEQRADVEKRLRELVEGVPVCCEECGMKIPAARLKALPSATHCVECAGQLEGSTPASRERASFPDDEPFDMEELEGEALGLISGATREFPTGKKKK